MTLAPYDLTSYPTRPAAPAADLHNELFRIVSGFVTGQERSQQVRIGPSEIGTPCAYCLGCKLAGEPELPEVDWLPFVGTCVHEKLAAEFTDIASDEHGLRWLIEQTVSVGEIDGVDITGHADLFDRATATVIDWKCVGATTLKKAKAGPSKVYQAQLHLYGQGFVRRGLQVDRVAIVFLPRNASSLREGVPWSEPFRPEIARDALARADSLARAIRLAGWAAVRPNLSRDPDCPNCHRYPNPDGSLVARRGRKTDVFSDVLAVA